MPNWELLHANAANCESRRLIERLAGWDFEIDGADWEIDAVDRLDWGWLDLDWLDLKIPEISE